MFGHIRKTHSRVEQRSRCVSSVDAYPSEARVARLPPFIMDEHRTETISHAGNRLTVSIHTGRYEHGDGLAVQLIDEADGLPYATVSVNVEGLTLKDDEFVFKTYSENEGLLEELRAAGVVEFAGQLTDFGPVCRLVADGH